MARQLTREQAQQLGAMTKGIKKTLTDEQRNACRMRLALNRQNRHPAKNEWVLSFSGGKDSTALLHVILREKLPLDRVLAFCSQWEYPEHDAHLKEVERVEGITIDRVVPRVSWWDLRRKWGWIHPRCRWCTGDKGSTLDRETKGCGKYIGLAFDEANRQAKYAKAKVNQRVRFPLIEYGLDQTATRALCKSLGYTFGGMYDHWKRPSCYCCPLQPIDGLRTLRRIHPQLWQEMIVQGEGQAFKNGKTVEELDARFANEDGLFEHTSHDTHGTCFNN